MDYPKDVEIFCWYKKKEGGGLYHIYGVAKHSVTGEWTVLYVDISNDFFHAIPIENFREEFEIAEKEYER